MRRMPLLPQVDPRWDGATCVVAGSGPSLTQTQCDLRRGVKTIAVNDAHRLLPDADILYACDARWWNEYDGMLSFAGERWSSHNAGGQDDKIKVGERWGLTLIAGRHSPGFSTNPTRIHYGENSGFQALNLAILLGAKRILLIGFDMRNHGTPVKPLRHFFGQHPKELRNSDPSIFIKNFVEAAKRIPKGVQIINCTPGSALPCFPFADLASSL